MGFAHYVFHGAEHTRFGHSLGVMKVADEIYGKVMDKDNDENKLLWKKIRIAALLHDIGHTPFSHSLEGIIEEGKRKISHEDYAERIILGTEIRDILDKEANFSKKDIKDIALIIRGKHPITLASQIIHSELDADRIDYLIRDSLYCGVKYGIFDYHRLIISLEHYVDAGEYLVITEKGRYVAEEYLLARYYMYLQVYTHKTKRSFELLAQRIFRELVERNIIHYPKEKNELDELAYYDDVWFEALLKGIAKNEIKENVRKKLQEWAKMLLFRKRLKKIDEALEFIEIRPFIKSEAPTASLKYHELWKLRYWEESLREFANKAYVDPEDIFVDGPEIEITKVPYYYSPMAQREEDEEIPIQVLKSDGELENIAADPNTLLGQIARRRISIIRLYAIEEVSKRVEEAWKRHLHKRETGV